MSRALPLALFVALVVAPIAAPRAAAQTARALLIGSSSVNGAVGRTLERELGERGVTLVRRARSSSGFARPDFFDWEEEIDRLGPFDRYAVVIVYAGGNDAQNLWLREHERAAPREAWLRWQDEARWSELYAERVRAAVDAMCEGGARHVVVIPPVDGGREGWRRRIGRVREAQRRGAEASRCGVAFDANDGTAFESHDGVHLTWEGARRMWTRLELPLSDILGRP